MCNNVCIAHSVKRRHLVLELLIKPAIDFLDLKSLTKKKTRFSSILSSNMVVSAGRV